MPRYRVPFLAAANQETDDGRVFQTLSARDLPLPLAAQWDTQHAFDGTSDVVGQIVEIDLSGEVAAAVIDVNPLDDTGEPIHPEGPRAAASIEQGGQGISIDGLIPPDATVDEECVAQDDDGFCQNWRLTFSEVIIGGATLTPMPAWSAAIVDASPLDAEEAIPEAMVASLSPVASLVARSDVPLTAAAAVELAGWAPVPEHFARPEALTPESNLVNLDGDGRIYGWLATDSCHQSFPGVCVRAADQSRDLSRFLRNSLSVGETVAPVGFLTMDRPHAGKRTPAEAAEAHYDDTRAIVAVVTAGWDGDRIWFSGSHRPDLTDWDRTVLAAAGVSGDWRANAGERERTLRAGLVVPVPGFVPERQPILASAAAPACSCGGGTSHAHNPQGLTVAQTVALARLADRALDDELADLDLAVLPPVL